MTSAGTVKITPAAIEDPADAPVCTMLFSRMCPPPSTRSTAIDTTAAGIAVEIGRASCRESGEITVGGAPAEDGIRDFHVTGVQTCALPIYPPILKIIPVVENDERGHGEDHARGNRRSGGRTGLHDVVLENVPAAEHAQHRHRHDCGRDRR